MKLRHKVGAVVVGLGATPLAFAETPESIDFSVLTTALDSSAVIAAIMAVAGVMVGIHVAYKGVQFVMRAIKGA